MTPPTASDVSAPKGRKREVIEKVTIRFAGDSGDGMQLIGGHFTNTTAVLGNDLATFPDFPAEIRAPAGSLPGVSGFQIQFSSQDIHTPGDKPDARLMKFALEVALKADKLAEGKDANIADTVAKAYYETGDAAKALEHQERALRLAKGTPQEKDPELLERLELYKKKAGKG